MAATQEPSGETVGSSRKAMVIDVGQSPLVATPWPRPGNWKKKLCASSSATCWPQAGGVMGSNSPAVTSVGRSLETGWFSAGAGGCDPQMGQAAKRNWRSYSKLPVKRGKAAAAACTLSAEVNGSSSAHCTDRYIPSLTDSWSASEAPRTPARML